MVKPSSYHIFRNTIYYTTSTQEWENNFFVKAEHSTEGTVCTLSDTLFSIARFHPIIGIFRKAPLIQVSYSILAASSSHFS